MTLNLSAHPTQAKKATKREWKEPNELEVPEELALKLKSEGFGTRWIRILLEGKPDAVNVMTRLREGYEFVTLDYAQDIWPDAPSYEHAKHGNLIVIGDLALAKMPLEISKDRARKMHAKTKNLTEAIQRQLYENQPLNQLLPISNTSKFSTRRGRAPTLDTED